MKLLIALVALMFLICTSGCMTSAVIQEAHRAPKPMESLATKDAVTGETIAPLDHPKANYLLLPLAIPADIVTSPFQLLMILLWPKC